MGMYTELNFNVRLVENVSPVVIKVLKHMLGEDGEVYRLEHPLFDTDRWEGMLRMDSYYFDADTHSSLRYDDIAGQYYLNIQCNLKNYSDEIGKFIDWIDPYVDAVEGSFLGYYRYEEDNNPTIIKKR